MCVQVLLPVRAFRLLNMHHISWPRSGERKWKSRLRLYTRVNFWLAIPRKWNSNDFNMPAGFHLRLMFYRTEIIFKKTLESDKFQDRRPLERIPHILLLRLELLQGFAHLGVICDPAYCSSVSGRGRWELRKSDISLEFKFTYISNGVNNKWPQPCRD